MNQTLTNFRQAVADSTDLQEKVKAGADLVTLGKENGYEFTPEELNAGWEELQESDEGLTEFEDKKLVAAAKGSLDLPESDEDKKQREETEGQFSGLIEKVKGVFEVVEPWSRIGRPIQTHSHGPFLERFL